MIELSADTTSKKAEARSAAFDRICKGVKSDFFADEETADDTTSVGDTAGGALARLV